MLSVLVFALYLDSDEVARLYNRPELLWLIIPVLGYWITQIWIVAARGRMDEDPISFAITDKIGWLAALAMMALLLVAMIP